MVDEVRASQTKQVEDYIDTLYQSTGVVKDYVEVEEQAGEETRKRIQDEKLRTEGLIQLKAAQENVIDFMKKLKTTTSLDKEILQINQYFDKLEKGISGGFNLKKEREEALAYIKEYSKNIGILELKLKQVTKVVDTGFDPYGDLDEGKRTGGRELIKYLYEEAEAEFAEFLGDSTAKVISTAIMQGTEDAKQVAADLLAQSISSTLQKSISESIQSSISGSTGAFFGGLGGGIVAGLVGASISKLAGGSDASDERTEVIKQQTEEIKRNTAAIQRNIDFLNNQFSTYSAAFNNASEELISVSQTFVRFTAGGGTAGDLDAVGITNQAIENLKKQRKTTEAILETWGKVFDGIAKQARANIEKIDAEIDKLEKSTEQFRTIINNIQLDIIKSSTEMAERAGDAFLSASQIQTREFQKAAKNLIVAFTESLTLEGTLPDWNVDFLKNFAPDQWEGMIALLKKVTENTDAYNDVLKLEANLIQTVTSLAKAQSIAIRDSMVNSLGSLTSIFDDLDFKLSGVSRQSWVEERIQDFEKIYKEVGKLTEKEFDTAISYISEWYNTVIQNEQQAANMWKEVADTVRSLSDDIESTIRSIQLGSLNVSLGTVKTKFAGEEYTRLLQAAKSGDQQAISEFIAFSSQYLQVAQDTYKSSESYRDIYEQVMRDLNELNTFVQTDDYAKLLYDTNMDLLNETIISNSILLSIREKMDNFSSTFAGFISSSTTVQPSPGSSLPPVSSGLNELLVQEAVDTARSTGVFRYGNLVENARDRYGADVAMDVMNSLADMDLGEVGRAIYDADAYKRLFGFLPAYANEGIALTPQIATLAEQGPEVVLDKSRFDDMVKNDSPTNLYIYLGNELIDKRVIQIQQNNTVKLGRRGSNPGRTF